MSTQTLTPNGFSSASSAFTVTGAGSVNAALADSSDSSYVKRAASDYAEDTSWLVLPCSNYTIPAGYVVKRVRVAVRALVPTGGGLSLGLADAGIWAFRPASTQYVTAKKWIYDGWKTVPAGGGTWTQERLDAAAVAIRDYAWNSSAYVSTIYEAKLEVEVYAPPTTTVTSPTGTISTSTTTVAWTYSDPQSSGLAQSEVKLFDSATYGGGSFDADTSTPLWSTTVAGSALSVTADVLPTTTQRAYVRTQSAEGLWSAWAYSGFTASIEGPADPAITCTWSTTNQRTTIAVGGRINELTANTASAETNIGTWAADTNVAATFPMRDSTWSDHGTWAVMFQSNASGACRLKTGTIGLAAPGDIRSARASLISYVHASSARVGIRWIGPNTITWGTASNLTTGTYKTYTVDSAVAPASTTGWEMVVEFTATASAQTTWVDKAAAHCNGPAAWSVGGGSSSDQTYTLERSYDGTTWEAIVTDTNLLGAQTATVIDNTCDRGGTVYYRATATAAIGGYDITGAAGAASSVTATSDGRFWLRCEDPTLDVGGVRIIRTLKATRDRNVGVFTPIVAADETAFPVVVEGGLASRSGSHDILTVTAAENTALAAVLALKASVLLQDPYGDQQWIRVTRHDTEKEGAAAAPQVKHKVGWVEVG